MTEPGPLPPLASEDDIAEWMPGVPDAEARVNAASASIRRYCGWHIAPVLTQTLVLDGPGGYRLMLPTLNLIDVMAFSQNGTAHDLLALQWSHKGYLEGWFSYQLRGISITVKHGFDEVPDLAQMVCDLASRASVVPVAVNREQAGSVSVSYREPGLMLHERDSLSLYKLPRRA